MEMRENAHTLDQLNSPNLLCLEHVGRWVQLLEHAVSQNPGRANFAGREIFLGTPAKRGGFIPIPAFGKCVAEYTRDGALNLKEQRIAREGRDQAGRGSKGGKMEKVEE